MVMIGGMALIFLLIVGALGALRGTRPAVAPVPAWADADGVDLEDRLRKITLSAIKPAEDAAPATMPRLDHAAERPAPAGSRDEPHERATKMFEAPKLAPPRIADPAPQPTGRLALPSAGSIKPADYAAPNTPNPGEGLSPLAARFGSFTAPGSSSNPAAEPPPPRRMELPGTVARDLGIPGLGDDDAGGSPFSSMPASPPSTRLSLPGTVAGGFGEPPALDSSPLASIAPPTESRLRREAFGPPAVRRPDGSADLAALAGGDQDVHSPTLLDIRAILRGDSAAVPAAPVGAGAFAESSRKPSFTTGPLPPAIDQGTPLGAVPFDPNLLLVREPLPTRTEPPKVPTGGLGAAPEFGGPASYEPAGGERVAANGRLLDIDATRLVEDFDLPDTGFETHVFSTAELVEGESLSFPAFPSAMPPIEAASGSFPAPAPAAPARSAASPFSPPQQEQARALIAELAGLIDVAFARLIGSDGSVILSGGQDTGDAALDGHIASLVKMADLEMQQLEFGTWQTLSLESGGAALLLSPVHAGVSLAVLLSNPTRLGLLRRQVRKPLAGLRTLLTESGVS